MIDPLQLAISMNLIQTDDEAQILEWVKQAMDKMPDKVLEYKKGKKGLLGLFVGEVKKISKGKADPQLTNQLLITKIRKITFNNIQYEKDNCSLPDFLLILFVCCKSGE